MGFYWGSLSFYVDVTDALFLERRQRAVQAVAGPVADCVLAGTLGLLALATAPSPLSVLCVQLALLGWIDAAINLVPFLKLDGYWFLADVLDRPDLAEHSRRSLLGLLSRPRASGQLRWATYALASLLFGILLLVSSTVAWIDAFGGIVDDAWEAGWVGRLLAIAFCGPLLAGLVLGMTRPLYAWLRKRRRSAPEPTRTTAPACPEGGEVP